MDEQLLMDRNGKIIPEAIATQYSETMWGIIKKAIDYSVEHSSTINPSESLFDFMSKVGKEVIDSEPESGINLKTLLECSELWSAYVGEDIRKQSLRHLFPWKNVSKARICLLQGHTSLYWLILLQLLFQNQICISTPPSQISSLTKSPMSASKHLQELPACSTKSS